MPTVTEFQGNPNSNVATFEIDADLLGAYEKVIIPRNSTLLAYSPLTQAIFDKAKGVLRVDMSLRDGKTHVALATKMINDQPLMQWTPESIARTQAFIAQFLEANALLLTDALAANVTPQPRFAPQDGAIGQIQGLVQNAFNDVVNPILARDGGAMELLNISVIPKTGKIGANVALIGACNGCDSAATQTLTNATQAIQKVLEAVKAKSPNNPALQTLTFTGIGIQEIEDVVLAR